jgi:hypothetical protein
MPLQDITTTVCSNGHKWGKSCPIPCSLSDLIVPDSSVFNYNVHSGANVYWVQQEGISSVIDFGFHSHWLTTIQLFTDRIRQHKTSIRENISPGYELVHLVLAAI